LAVAEAGVELIKDLVKRLETPTFTDVGITKEKLD
jgi:hypothetical protein